MDPRVIGNVHRPGLSSTGKAGSAGAIQRIGSRAGAEGAIAEANRQAAVLVALELLSLPGSQRPHICSVISNPRRAKWLPKLSIKVIP